MQPAVAICVASIDAVSWFALTKVVDCGLLLNCTIEPANCAQDGGVHGGMGFAGAIKFEPLTVSVNVAPAGLAVAGLMPVIEGVAACTGLIMNVAEFWLKPPPGAGFEAVICAIPAVATSEGRTASAI